jgi:hypothetical protein
MENLRIVNVKINSSTSITVSFTDNLTSNLTVSNVLIKSNTINVPDSQTISISVNKKDLEITSLPLSSFASYYLELKSTNKYPFISINGESKLLEDGINNKYYFIAPIEPENPIQSNLKNYFKDNIYNIDDDTTVVGSYVRSLSKNLARALYDIRQVKNENYLSTNIVDERIVRGDGPYDRLSEEGAYEIIRVGLTPAGTSAHKKFTLSYAPFYPISLQKESYTEILTPDSINENGKFNINDLILNVNKLPIIKVNSIIFTINSATPIYKYNIENLGYQIFDSKYDQEYGFTYPLLNNNQIKLNDQIISDPLFDINNIINVSIEYEYKNLGLIVSSDSVTSYTFYNSIREVLPPIINVFNLKHAPIVNNSGTIPDLAGITFTDPNQPPNGIHPAFKNEIPFRLNGLPSMPGQYSIDYSTGTVYVYGEDFKNDGTGPYPPLATYKYKYTFKQDQDYTFDNTTYDIVALPIGNLINNPGFIEFDYEQVLVPGIDYDAQVHKEALSERIENRIVALNAIKVKNTPITNVFQVYNETTGEIYVIDRWDSDKIYIKYFNAPNIQNKKSEKVSFNNVSNELLFVDSFITNSSFLKVFKILLKNNNIIAATEDAFGSSINTSVSFSKIDIFAIEKWFDKNQLVEANIDNLKDIGEYCIDYINGIIYCAVSNTQDNNIGTINYKSDRISLINPHIISVDDVYYQIDPLSIKNKQISYISFNDGYVIPDQLQYSDEDSLNNVTESFYQILNGSVGSFVDAQFVPGVTNQVKFVRSLFEFDDLINNNYPINFANYSEPNNFNITVNNYYKEVLYPIEFDGTNYFIKLNENITYLSPNISFNFNVIRVSDSAELWDNSGYIVPGEPAKLILSGVNAPAAGQLVNVIYNFTIENLSRIIVDYNKGDLFIDYSYLSDEILVSYEYGDNVIDFRSSTTVSANTGYYASYKVGALRDALLKNFGNLVNIPELTNVDLTFDRERYRDSLTAAMSSFIQGPTLSAIKNIGKTISHIEPQVIESAFENWSLGSSVLNPSSVKTTGEFNLLPAKYYNGVLINSENQTISLPASSNLRLEEGTFETWISPEWNGLDNDATLTFEVNYNNNLIDSKKVFIGASEYHPTIKNRKFTINKKDILSGSPNTNKDGVFIYYDKDISGSFNRWYVQVIDGYVDGLSYNYKFKISSNGSFYDSKSLEVPTPANLNIFSGNSLINFSIIGNGLLDQTITFLSDIDHYLLDLGEEKNINRLSLFKDVSGYFNFKVFDKDKNTYSISADVSNWKSGELHHIAASWKLNNRDCQDEMHLFIDGLEVPNIIKYSQKLQPYLHQKFRTISSEEILGLNNKDIISSIDLKTTINTNTVTSSINFSAYNISIGDQIFIDEDGFNVSGYTITGINGQTLTLNSVMPLTISNGRYSVNRTSFVVNSDIDISSNIAVSRVPAAILGSDLTTVSGTNIVTSLSKDFDMLGVSAGDLIRIEDPSLELTYNIIGVSSNSITITDDLPVSLTNANFTIYSNNTAIEIPGTRALFPSYSIFKDVNRNNNITISNNLFANDLIIINTLGLNHRLVKHKYYMWSNNTSNIITTKMPAPISFDDVAIKKIILPSTIINSSNATLSGGIYDSNNLDVFPPSNSENGRTISATISGNNVDFSSPVTVTIEGLVGINTVSETITFSDYGTVDFTNKYLKTNYVKISVKPIDINKNAVVLECKEKYSITQPESSTLFGLIKYAYTANSGIDLYSNDGYTVTDNTKLFNGSEIGNYLVINSPPEVAGYYKIIDVSFDRKTLTLDSAVPAFTLPLSSFSNGIYQIIKVTDSRSGFENGFFIFESSYLPSQGYLLSKGFYDIEYQTYLQIKISSINSPMFIGSDFNGSSQINSILDQVKIYSTKLTDTRIGESIPQNQRSITKDFNSLKPLTKDNNTLVLMNFDSYPFTNDADFYKTTNYLNKHFQSALVVNENFGNSLVLLDDPLIIPNDGILDTKKQATIEFWVNPIFDTGYDLNERYYFDAFGAVVEEAVSTNNVSIKLKNPASKILSIKLKNGDPNIDYFAGGSIEIDTQDAIREQSISISNGAVNVSRKILQVIKVQIASDIIGTDYFADGQISTDRKTIYLGKTLPQGNLPLIITYKTSENYNPKLNSQVIRLNKKLPYQNSQVVVSYIPKGLQGDRISIYKDKSSFMNFSIVSSGNTYLVRTPIIWSKNTWHRVKASYKINGGIGNDEMRLFLDGYEYSNIELIADSSMSSQAIINMYTDGYNLKPNIKFKDSINTLYVGSQYNGQSSVYSLIDNLRISNISREMYAPYGYPLDINYNSNIDMVFPVTSDLYTTYLLDFNQLTGINTDFAVIKNRNTGSFDFSVNILDSFGIVNSSAPAQRALEKLIKALKPANSKVFIKYIR